MGKPVFAWQKEDMSWLITIPGLMSCGGKTLEQAEESAKKHIKDSSREDYDRYLSIEEFNKIMSRKGETK
jgi:hypothetical protein